MGVVVFDPAGFKQRFPTFAEVTDDALRSYFDRTGLYLSNTEGSPVRDVKIRSMLLDLLVAHIAQLSGQGAGAAAGGANGIVASASEGSVSVSFNQGNVSERNAWFLRTPWGAEYWSLTARYRTARYITGRSLPAHHTAGVLPWGRRWH